MKKDFLTGLALLLPIVITVWLSVFLLGLLTQPFYEAALFLLEKAGWSPRGGLLTPQWLKWLVELLILIVLLVITLLIGMAASHFIGRKLFSWSDALFHRIPVLNRVYKACQEAVSSIFQNESKSFSQVVLVPFPHDRCYSIGFLSSSLGEQEGDLSMISVFVPATPNPTMGFVLFFEKRQIIFLPTKVDQALKFIISCGVIAEGLPQKEVPTSPLS